MTFAEKIKSLRKGKGLTQMQLASATSISLGVIADIESGRRAPSKEVAKRFSEYFNVPVQAFILESFPIEKQQQTINTANLLLIADIVSEYLQKNGYKITPEQRVALVDHFYQQNITDTKKINEGLSVLGAMQFESSLKR